MSTALAAPSITEVDLDRLRGFVRDLAGLIDRTDAEERLLSEGGSLLRALVAQDDWLPDAYAVPNPDRYTQYLLYRDPAERFSVVSFVWGPGQRTPIHDHTVWGLVGVLRGAEIVENYEKRDGGLHLSGTALLQAGEVDELSPRRGDIHRVANGVDGAVSVSIHVYGADIGVVERAIFEVDGTTKPFVSRYVDAPPLELGKF